jgi:transposase-like protein
VFFDKNACESYILKKLHNPLVPVCPRCRTIASDLATIENFVALDRCRCKSCGKWYTATTGTILHGTSMDMRQVVLLAALTALDVPLKIIARKVGMHPDSVRIWQRKLSL